MHLSSLVNRVDSRRQLPSAFEELDAARFRVTEALLQSSHIRCKVFAANERHREEANSFIDHQVVQIDQVRVNDVSKRTELALQSHAVFRAKTMQHLQGDFVTRRSIVDTKDGSHATTADDTTYL